MKAQQIPDRARIVQVVLPYATFGLAVAGGKVVACAPYARRTVEALGRDERAVADHYRALGAKFRFAEGTEDDRAVACASRLG